MTSLCRILSLPHGFYSFKLVVVNAPLAALRANTRNFSKLILTQSRNLFVKKSTKNVETKAETEKQHDLFQLNYFPKQINESMDKLEKASPPFVYSNLSDIAKKIEDGPLNFSSLRLHLFGMLRLYRRLRSSPDFSEKMNAFIKSKEFEKFSQALEQSMPMALTKHLYLMFQTLHYYQIPNSSILMQKLHALILDNINQFELLEVIKMYLMIKDKNDILLQPLENAFSAYMKHLTSDSLKFIGDIKSLAYFVSIKEVPFSVREKILKKILSLKFQFKDLDPIILTWLSNPLCSGEFQSLDKTYFFDALKNSADNFEYKDLKTVLENIINGVKKKVIKYNGDLLDVIANCAAKYDLLPASTIMSALLRAGHVNYKLADAIAEKLITSDTASMSMANIEQMIYIFGQIDYKNYSMANSDNWFKLKCILKDWIKPGIDFKNLQTPLNLFILEMPSAESVSKALNNVAKTLESHEEVPGIALKRACLMHQCHCAIYSSPPENVPEKFIFECYSRLKDLLSFNLREAMYEVFNGEEYVLEKCRTPFGTLISYVVILGPAQDAISLSSYKKSQRECSNSVDDFIEIEKIQRPFGSKVLGFIEYTKEIIRFRNLPLLRPEPRLINSIHKNQKYKIFHLFFNQEKADVKNYTNILFKIMAGESKFSPMEEKCQPLR